MQEGIIQIGEIVSGESDFLDSLVSEVSPGKGKKRRHVLKFDFSTERKEVRLDTLEEMSEGSSRKYLYIGGAPGANSKQWYSTATNHFYHLSETIPNLTEMDLGEEWNEKLCFIRDHYYIDLGREFTNNKNRYAFDFRNLEGNTFDIKDFYLQKEGLSLKEKKEALKKELLSQLKKEVEKEGAIKLNEIGLCTILIDGKPLCRETAYRDAVRREKAGQLKVSSKGKVGKGERGCCYYCGAKEQLRSDINIEIKSYTTNLHGFASGTDKKNYGKNMLLCQPCLDAWLAGEKFIKNRLSIRLARFWVYLYPHFILGEPLDLENLKDVCGRVKHSFQAIASFQEVSKFQKELEESLENEEKTYYMLNFVFYRQVQKGTKIQRFIQDVNPFQLKQIKEALDKVNDLWNRFYCKDHSRTFLNLNMIYYLFPIREDKGGEALQYRKLLELYDSILTGKKVSKNYLIGSFNESIRILMYDRGGYNIHIEEDTPLQAEFLGAKQEALIKFLMIMQNLDGGEAMDVEQLQADENVRIYLWERGYREEEAALFFLGMAIGKIGISQYKETKTKPILKKLNYAGMGKEKVVKLAGLVEGKIVQEKMFGELEKYMGLFHQLYDLGGKVWRLNKEENLYYILAGYNYVTLAAITNKDQKEKEKREGEQEDE